MHLYPVIDSCDRTIVYGSGFFWALRFARNSPVAEFMWAAAADCCCLFLSVGSRHHTFCLVVLECLPDPVPMLGLRGIVVFWVWRCLWFFVIFIGVVVLEWPYAMCHW